MIDWLDEARENLREKPWLALLLLPGLFIVGAGGWMTVKELRASAFTEVAGTVTSSEVEVGQRRRSSSSYDTIYTPTISYQYERGGKTYSSNQIRPAGNTFYWEESEAQEVLAKLVRGSDVTVYVDDSNPEVSFLDVSGEHTGVGLLALGLLVLAMSAYFTLRDS